jgi:hypothetical protein
MWRGALPGQGAGARGVKCRRPGGKRKKGEEKKKGKREKERKKGKRGKEEENGKKKKKRIRKKFRKNLGEFLGKIGERFLRITPGVLRYRR